MSTTAQHSPSRDAEIAQEIAKIRHDYPYQGNYREQMAALLSVMFFKFGERVGANRLAAMLAENGRSPSTSTAQDEINRFWNKVRENSAIKLNRPDLPPFLVDMFATMAGAVWEKSMSAAEDLFISHRQEVAAKLATAQKETEQAREHLALARAGAEQALHQVQLANEAREALRRELAAESLKRAAAEANVVAATERLALAERTRAEEAERLQRSLEDVKSGLAHATDEQRRLMTIGDEFKQQAARDRAQRTKAETRLEQLVEENKKLQDVVTQLSSEKGMLEGRLSAQGDQLQALLAQRARDSLDKHSPGMKKKAGVRARVRTR